jgi:tartrate-resistant acid phosphatase type 5
VFIFHGDWGWNSANQTKVAYQMGETAAAKDASFVIALGDNFYEDGVVSVTDSMWDDAFHSVYTSSSLKIPWYAVLGNHDYHGSVSAQVQRTTYSYENMWTMPASYYSYNYLVAGGGVLTIIYIDTSLLDPYARDTSAILDDNDWQNARNNHLDWIESAIRDALESSQWIVVAGHYPIYSIGSNGDDSTLITDLLPILEQ